MFCPHAMAAKERKIRRFFILVRAFQFQCLLAGWLGLTGLLHGAGTVM